MALGVEAAFVVLLACVAGVELAVLGSGTKPQLASSTTVPYNPTETTIVWSKPFCVFQKPVPTTQYVVDVYASITNNSYAFDNPMGTALSSYWANPVSPSPYLAATFDVPECGIQASSFDAMAVKTNGTFRLGGDTACVNSIGPSASACNGPLVPGMKYRVKYTLSEATTQNPRPIVDQTPWSDPVSTKKSPAASTINTWPGKRTGGMVVVTAVLSTLLFLLLAALLLVVIFKACSSDTQELTKPTQVEAPPLRTVHSTYKTHYTNKGYGEDDNAPPAKPERYQ